MSNRTYASPYANLAPAGESTNTYLEALKKFTASMTLQELYTLIAQMGGSPQVELPDGGEKKEQENSKNKSGLPSVTEILNESELSLDEAMGEEKIWVSSHRPDLFFVPVHFSRQDIADYLFTDKSPDAFTFVETSVSASQFTKYPMLAIKPRDYNNLTREAKTKQAEFAERTINKFVLQLEMSISELSDEQIIDEIQKISQLSEVLRLNDENFFDYFIGQLKAKGLVEKIKDELSKSEFERFQKAVTNRSVKYASDPELNFETKDSFTNVDAEGFISGYPVIGRFYSADTKETEQVKAIRLLVSGEDREVVEAQTRNSPERKIKAEAFYAKALLAKKEEGQTTYYGLEIEVGQQSYSTNKFNFETTKGNFYWYYPETELFLPGETKAEFGKANSSVKSALKEIADLALIHAQGGDYRELLALDYDAISEAVGGKTNDPVQQADEQNKQNIALEMLKLILSGQRQEKIPYHLKGDAVAFLARLFNTVSDTDSELLFTHLEKNNGYAELQDLLKYVEAEQLSAAALLGEAITKREMRLAKSELTYEIDKSIRFTIGKDKDGIYHLVTSELKLDEKTQKPVFVLNQIKDKAFSFEQVNNPSKPLSPTTFVELEFVGKNTEPGSGSLKVVTVAELAVISSGICSNLEWEQLMGEILDVVDLILITSSLIAPVTTLAKIAGPATLRTLLLTGSREALKKIARRLLTHQGKKAIGSLVLNSLIAGVFLFDEEIEETTYGKEFMAGFRVFIGAIIARDLLRLAASPLAFEMYSKARVTVAQLYAKGKMEAAGALQNSINELKTYLNSYKRFFAQYTYSPEQEREIIAQMLNGEKLNLNVLAGEQRLQFSKILLEERRLATQESMLSTLGKTGTEATEIETLLKELEAVGGRNDELAVIIRKVFRKMDKLPAEELKSYVGSMRELINSINGVRNIEEVMPFIELSASRKKVLTEFGGPAGVLQYARRFGNLPREAMDAEVLDGIAREMAAGKVNKAELDEMLKGFRTRATIGKDWLNTLKTNSKFKKLYDDLVKNPDLRKFANLLSEEEEAVLKFYTTNTGYKNFNRALREEAPMTDFYMAQKNLMNQALSKLPNSSYNGSKNLFYRIENLTEGQILSNYIEGSTITASAFTSATYSETAIVDAMRNRSYTVLIRIEGKSGKLIEDLSTLPSEKEILFQTEVKFKIIKVGKSANPGEDYQEFIKTIWIKEI